MEKKVHVNLQGTGRYSEYFVTCKLMYSILKKSQHFRFGNNVLHGPQLVYEVTAYSCIYEWWVNFLLFANSKF